MWQGSRPRGPFDIARRWGALVGLDCSWAQIDDSVQQVMRRTRPKGKNAAIITQANPVNWGKPSKLSTAEALAASLYLIGNEEQARDLMSAFNWGEQFLC